MTEMGNFYVDEEEGLLVLEDAEGNKDFFTIEMTLQLAGHQYMILVREEEEEEEEGVVFRVEKDADGMEIWCGVEDSEELARVQGALEAKYEEEEP